MRPPAVQSALQSQYRLALYKTWEGVGLSAIRPAGAVMTLILIGLGSGGCSLNRADGAFAKMDDKEVTGSLGPQASAVPTDGDLAFVGARVFWPQLRPIVHHYPFQWIGVATS